MSFFVSKELQGKLTEENITNESDFLTLESGNSISLRTKINGEAYSFPVDKIKVKKNKTIITYLLDYENNILNRVVDTDQWDQTTIETNGSNIYSLSQDYDSIKLKKIVRAMSGYNYKVTIIMYKRN